MRRRLVLIATSIVASAAFASSAHAAFFAGEPLDGPSADIRSVGDVDIARDGTGAVAYVKRDGGVDHIFVSRLVNGGWAAPERVDVGVDATSSQPVVAASDGGRLAVAWIGGGTVFASVRQAGAPAWGAPQPIVAGASDPSIDMSFNGAAYLTFTVNGGDVGGARMDRTATAFVPLTGPLDADPARTAGADTGRSRVAIAADGTGVAVWGEAGHVYARRMYGTSPSLVVQDLTLPDLEGHVGGIADAPSVDIEDDSSFAWVAFREQFADGAGGTQARAVGVRLRGSRSDAPVVYDGQAWGGQSIETPEVDLNGKGVGVMTAGTSGGVALSAVIKDDKLSPARAVGGTGSPAHPVGAVAETYDRAVSWINVADGSAHGVFYDDKSSSRLVPGPGPDTLLSNPQFGAVDPSAGFDTAGDRTGDFAFTWIQASGDARRLVVASYDRLPGAFTISTSSKNWRNVVKNPLAWGTALDLWGPLTYTVLIDGKPVTQTQTTKAALAVGALAEGLHTWRVTATDRRGQSVTTAVKPLKVDTVAPTASFSVKKKKRVVTVTTKAADVIPPSGQASGVKYVRIDWGDGSGYEQARTASHSYGRTGAFTVRVSATDKAGNSVATTRVIHISAAKKKK
ncbi:PKD domain-containing protein [Baekduia sp. Peel2402]|uniref:PKD domain-containing protein n=1 Tax=Baekduia sp. Peel2402 TaxID=3458296 RepID=UPI00403E8215